MKSDRLTIKGPCGVAVCAAIAQSLVGCHSSSGASSAATAPLAAPPPVPAAAPPPTPSEPATHGYFAGGMFVDDSGGHYAEALLTVDGLVRIFVDGVPGAPNTLGSRQFVGHLEFTDGQAYGTGLVHTQGCDQTGASTVCGGAVPAEVAITTATRNLLLGEITLSGGEVWSFQMGWPTITYLEPAALEFASGQYTEVLAKAAYEAVITVDSGGRLFFQSPESGCVGNGTLAPHGDGTFNVYNVALRVENCASGYESSNGEFQGLATRTIGGAWDYWGDWLVAWLSSPETAQVQQAFVMWGSKIPE